MRTLRLLAVMVLVLPPVLFAQTASPAPAIRAVLDKQVVDWNRGDMDAFAAGYIYAYLDGQLYHEMREERAVTALAFGNALAALKRCIAGDIAIITPQEVRALLEKREGSKRFR